MPLACCELAIRLLFPCFVLRASSSVLRAPRSVLRAPPERHPGQPTSHSVQTVKNAKLGRMPCRLRRGRGERQSKSDAKMSVCNCCEVAVHLLFTCCLLAVNLLLTCCSLDVNLLFTCCSLAVHLLFTCCSLAVHLRKTVAFPIENHRF